MTIGPFLLFCITYIFYLLGDFSFPVGEMAIPFYFIIGTGLLIILFVRNQKVCLSVLRTALKTKQGKLLLYFSLWAVLTIIVSLFQGTFKLGSFFSNFIGNFFNSFLFPVLLACILITQIKINRKLKMFLFITAMTILVIGMIELIALTFNIGFIKDTINMLVNRTAIARDLGKVVFGALENPRIHSLFREPGEYAGFLVVSSPLFFYLGNLKEKLFKNTFIDTFLKKTMILLWIFNLMKTQSPINIVFIGIILAGWAILNIKYIIKHLLHIKYFIALCISLILLISLTAYSIVKQELFVQRIVTALTNISSVDAIVENEPSLATRICTHEAQIRMGLHYPVFGVGYANMNSVWGQYIFNLPHALTPEVYKYALDGKQMGGSAFIWKIFAETGIPGVILLYAFWISLFLKARKIAGKSSDKEFIEAFNYSLLIYLIYSWYLMLAPVFMVYCGILLGIICKNKRKKLIIIKKAE
ncbi:hypothetical protein IKQ26_01320 [bacterium]|nr:hypothetical protein [bacterium]